MSTPLPNTNELSLPSDGGDNDIWGLENNSLHSGWDRFLGGAVTHDMTAADWIVTTDEAQNARIWLTGTSASARTVLLPAGKYRTWVVLNFCPTFMRISQGATFVDLPQFTAAVIGAVPGLLSFAGPPIEISTGGFPGGLIQPGFGYVGPGMFFSNREVGLGSPAVGYMEVFLSQFNASSELRFQAPNTAAQPLIAALRGGPAWDTGFYFPSGTEVCVSALGQDVARLTASGVAVGGNNPVGPGTVNANQFFRSGQPMPFQFPVLMQFGLGAFQSTPHGVGGPPTGIFGKLHCIAADIGYNIGDLIDAAVTDGLAYGADAGSGFCCATGNITLPRKGTGVREAAIKARWILDLHLAWP